MDSPSHTIHVIDDAPSFRKGLCRLLGANGFRCAAFASADEFLAASPLPERGCVLLDVNMPGLDGFGLQERLAGRDCTLPVVFLTGRGSIPLSVRAIKCGAVDFLTKPVAEKDLLRAVGTALEENERRLGKRTAYLDARKKISSLSDRELEVLTHVITGAMNKQIADRLGIAEKTVKVHRGRVVQKLEVVSVAELVRLCDLAGIVPARDGT